MQYIFLVENDTYYLYYREYTLCISTVIVSVCVINHHNTNYISLNLLLSQYCPIPVLQGLYNIIGYRRMSLDQI